MRYTEILEACWKGYRQQGIKKKGDRMVPNCVPVSEQEMEEDLRKWFKEKWVRFGPDGKIRGSCARGSESEGKPKCLPQSKAHALGKKGRASAAAKKRREDPNPERRGPAKNVATKVREDTNPKFAGLIKNIQARMKKDDYQRPEIMKRVAQMVQQADPTVQDAMTTAQQLVQQYGQEPVEKQTNVWDLKAQARSGNLSAQLPKTSAGTPSYAQQHATFEEQYTDDDDWYDEEEINLKSGDYVRDRQDGESGEIFRMQGDPYERRVQILDRDGRGWYISPDRLEPVDPTDPDIQKYFGKRRHRDMDEGRKIVPAETTIANAKKLWLYTQRNLVDLASNSEFDSKHNELFIDEKLNGLLKTASGQPVQVAFDQGGNIEFNNGILYIPIEAMYYYRGYMTSQKFVQDVVQALDQTQIAEKQDACYRKVKSRYKVWPSAYASGALVQCRKKGAANWGTGGKKK